MPSLRLLHLQTCHLRFRRCAFLQVQHHFTDQQALSLWPYCGGSVPSSVQTCQVVDKIAHFLFTYGLISSSELRHVALIHLIFHNKEHKYHEARLIYVYLLDK